MIFSQTIGGIQTDEQFNRLALEAFRYQLQRNEVYAEFVDVLGIHASVVNHYTRIPFLPIEFYKTREVYAAEKDPAVTFHSSGTTKMLRSTHAVADVALYRSSLLEAFRYFYGEPANYLICALTPSPEENPYSSLAYMIQTWINAGAQQGSGFYLNEPKRLAKLLQIPDARYQIPDKSQTSDIRIQASGIRHQNLILIGLTYALLDFAEQQPMPLSGSIVMETGGMKGRKKELTRESLHETLSAAFGVPVVHKVS